jgi:hypothetical protein
MRQDANRIATSNQSTTGVEGYVFDGADGRQMAFWTCHETLVSKAHVHDYDEYMLVVQDCYTVIIDGLRIPLKAGEGYLIPHAPLGDFQPGDELEVDFLIECWLTPQSYTLTVATQNADGSSHDWLDDAIAFDVVDTRVAAGVANLRAKVEWRVSR